MTGSVRYFHRDKLSLQYLNHHHHLDCHVQFGDLGAEVELGLGEEDPEENINLMLDQVN